MDDEASTGTRVMPSSSTPWFFDDEGKTFVDNYGVRRLSVSGGNDAEEMARAVRESQRSRSSARRSNTRGSHGRKKKGKATHKASPEEEARAQRFG